MNLPDQNSYCLIWGKDYKASELYDSTGYFPSRQSDRAGGAYKMRSDTRYALEEKSDAWRARLTTWLINQRERGDEAPMIDAEVINHIDRQPRLLAHERAERLLRFLAGRVDILGTVGARVDIGPSSPVGQAACAWSESIEWEEVLYFVRYLKSKGWFDRLGDPSRLIDPMEGSFTGTVTVEGYSQIAEQETNVDSSQAFIAMWFDDSMDKAYEEGIAPAIREAGYKALRIDRKEHSNKIDDEIIAEIRRSRFLVADFTQGEDGARGGVYFEAGFAHGLDIPVIYACREDVKDKLAFDTRQYNHIMWKTTDELREGLKNRIEAVIGEGPDKGRSKIGALTVNP